MLNLCRAVLLAGLSAIPALSVADVMAHDPWLRESVPGAANGAGFMVLHNPGNTPVSLVGARTDAAQRAEIHEHVMVGEMMRMQQIEELVVPAGGQVVLQPGGYHLMLM